MAENEYAVTFDRGCQWTLTGGTLDAAAAAAERVRNQQSLGDRSLDVLEVVNATPQGSPRSRSTPRSESPTPAVYLGRLHDSDRIGKASHGVYVPCTPVTTVSTVAIVTDDDPEALAL